VVLVYQPEKIKRPIEKHFVSLPPVYEQYLSHQQKSGHVAERSIKQIRRVLVAFERYLKSADIALDTLEIEHVDDFLAQFLVGFAPTTCKLYRGFVKGFLKHLYQINTISRNLAPLVVGRRLYARQKPPKFLRPSEVKKLFAGQIIVLEIINIVVIPMLTLSTVPFPLTLGITTGLLPILQSWMGYEPAFTYPAWTFACGAPGHRFLSCHRI
jgi:hypothetical protein